MDKNENRGIGAGWFKSNILNKSTEEDFEEERDLEEDKENRTDIVEDKPRDAQQIKSMLSKNNKDKIVLDLIMPLENLIKDRQMLILNKSDLEDKLRVANEAMDRMKKNIESQERRLEIKDNEVKSLEENLSNKQMNYDQLLEDYREFQRISSDEYEEISNKLDMEVNKYKRYNEEVVNEQYLSMQKINVLEDKIRSLEIEKQQYLDNYNRVNEEKNKLMKSIDDFTKRMTFSFPTKSEEDAKIEEVKEAPVTKTSAKEEATSSQVKESEETKAKPDPIKPGMSIKPGRTISPGAGKTEAAAKPVPQSQAKPAATNNTYTPNPVDNQNIRDAINRIRTINTGKPQE